MLFSKFYRIVLTSRNQMHPQCNSIREGVVVISRRNERSVRCFLLTNRLHIRQRRWWQVGEKEWLPWKTNMIPKLGKSYSNSSLTIPKRESVSQVRPISDQSRCRVGSRGRQ